MRQVGTVCSPEGAQGRRYLRRLPEGERLPGQGWGRSKPTLLGSPQASPSPRRAFQESAGVPAQTSSREGPRGQLEGCSYPWKPLSPLEPSRLHG